MTDVKAKTVAHQGLKLDRSLTTFSISLDNIGNKENGLPPEEIAAVLIPKVQDAVIDAMMRDLTKTAIEIFKKLGGMVDGAIKGVSEGAGAAMKSVTEGAGGAAEGVGDAAKKATDGIKGLFGK
jgi:hypothetical protein